MTPENNPNRIPISTQHILKEHLPFLIISHVAMIGKVMVERIKDVTDASQLLQGIEDYEPTNSIFMTLFLQDQHPNVHHLADLLLSESRRFHPNVNVVHLFSLWMGNKQVK